MDSGRERPKDAEIYDWNQFEEYCELQGIGIDEEDFGPWWDCWKEGYMAGYRADEG